MNCREELVSCSRRTICFVLFLIPYQAERSEEEDRGSSFQKGGGGLEREQEKRTEGSPQKHHTGRTKPWQWQWLWVVVRIQRSNHSGLGSIPSQGIP